MSNSSALQAAIALFDPIPHDALSEEVARLTRAKLYAAIQPYLGAWYLKGDPVRPCQVSLRTETDGNEVVDVVSQSGRSAIIPYLAHELDIDRGLRLMIGDRHVTLSADGKLLEIETFKECWSREPIAKDVK